MHIQVRGQLGSRDAAVPCDQLEDRGHPGVELVDVGVDLNPVACRDHEGLGHRVGVRQVHEQLGQRVTTDRGPFQERHRSALVTEADHERAHPAHLPGAPHGFVRRVKPPARIGEFASYDDDDSLQSAGSAEKCPAGSKATYSFPAILVIHPHIGYWVPGSVAAAHGAASGDVHRKVLD